MADVKHISDDTFQSEVEGESLVLVDFWAPWCGPCQMVGPILDEIARELDGKVKICKMNIDENKKVAGELEIMSIPTILLYKGGKVVETSVGAHSKEELVALIEKHVS
jgi:thioredoxin 1